MPEPASEHRLWEHRPFYAWSIGPALALGLALLLASPEGRAVERAPAPQTAAALAFARLSHAFIEAYWRLDPDAALQAGRYDGAARLPVPDAAARQARLAFVDAWQRRLAAVDEHALGPHQRTDLAQLRNHLALEAFDLNEWQAFRWDPSTWNVAGPLDQMLHTPYAPNARRLRDLMQRVGAIPAYFAAARAAIERPTREHTELALAQVDGQRAVLDDIGRAARSSRALAPSERSRFAHRLAAAQAALSDHAALLRSLLQRMDAEPGWARSFRAGAERYEQKFRLEIQSSRSAAQTYEAALQAREQLYAQMLPLADQLWPQVMGDAPRPDDRLVRIGRVIDRLSERHVARSDFYAEIRRQIPRLQAWVQQHDLLTLDPRKPLVVRETPPYQRGVAGAGIEAPGPYRPQDPTYYNVTPLDDLSDAEAESTLREYNHWMLQILNIHEAIPGHYAQLVHANRSPSLVKTLFGNGAMVEGWAVFSERMMLESGYGNQAPEMWLMWCKWNLRSVTNTLLDYGVHVQGLDEAQALDLLIRQAFQTESEAREKWRRVQLTSVQLTSYFSGYSEIMALRDAWRARQGEHFSVKAFNERFLSYGNAPVSLISDLMKDTSGTR